MTIQSSAMDEIRDRSKALENSHPRVQNLLRKQQLCDPICPAVEGSSRNLPWMMNPTLITHTPIAIATAVLLLFQIAALVASIRALFVEMIMKRKCNEYLHAKNDQ